MERDDRGNGRQVVDKESSVSTAGVIKVRSSLLLMIE